MLEWVPHPSLSIRRWRCDGGRAVELALALVECWAGTMSRGKTGGRETSRPTMRTGFAGHRISNHPQSPEETRSSPVGKWMFLTLGWLSFLGLVSLGRDTSGWIHISVFFFRQESMVAEGNLGVRVVGWDVWAVPAVARGRASGVGCWDAVLIAGILVEETGGDSTDELPGPRGS